MMTSVSNIENMTEAEQVDAQRHNRIISLISLVIFIVFSVAIFIFVGRPMLEFIAAPEGFRNWVDEHGWLGRLAFVGMMVLQIMIAIIPGEPLEVGAGYAFGVWEGTVLCLLGALVGSSIIYVITRYWGVKAVQAIFPNNKIQSMSFLQNSKKLNMLVFILFLIPGTPKDLLTYMIGLTSIKFSMYLMISSIARIPSIVTSTLGGEALGGQNYITAIWVFGITLVISAVGIIFYKRMQKKSKNREKSVR